MSSREVNYLHANTSIYPNTTPDDRDGATPKRGFAEVLAIAALLAVIVVVTIAGNLLVIATVWTNRNMHNVTNYFLVSLATTDLLLGCVVLPLSVVNTLNPFWPFGAVFCNVYISCDVMLCTVSILTLFAISLDRYFAVTTPLRYQGSMNSRIVWRVSAGIWVFSFAMAFVPIHFGWNTSDGRVQNTEAPEVCSLELNGPYVLLISLGTYFAPLIIMSAVYIRVLQITRKQVKEINKLGRLARTPSKMSHDHQNCRPKKSFDKNSIGNRLSSSADMSTPAPAPPTTSAIVSDRKATVNLASIVLAFAICWIPYFVLFTLKPFVDLQLSSGFGYHLDLFALWLGYTNSSINPFLYAFYNSSFRNGFRRFLCSRFTRRDHNHRGSLLFRSHDGLPAPSNNGRTNDWSAKGVDASRSSPRMSTAKIDEATTDEGTKLCRVCCSSPKNVEKSKVIETGGKTTNGVNQGSQASISICQSKTNLLRTNQKGVEGKRVGEHPGVLEGRRVVVGKPCSRKYLSFDFLRTSRHENFVLMSRRTSWHLPSATNVSVV